MSKNHPKALKVKKFTDNLKKKVAQKTQKLIQNHQITPALAVVLVGDNPASQVYVTQKIKSTQACGMVSIRHRLSEDTLESEVFDLIQKLNQDPGIHGILVQLPLPKQISEVKVISAINPLKDVDGFHFNNVGRLHSQQNHLIPCTPLGCSLILKDHFQGNLSGKHAVVLGRSRIVGRPMAELLLQENCTVTMAHSSTPPQLLANLTGQADILIVAVGKLKMIKGHHLKKDAVVIDVGINRMELKGGKVHIGGDVDFESAIQVASAITPVPGGVGLLTVSCLLLNTYRATCWQHNLTPEI